MNRHALSDFCLDSGIELLVLFGSSASGREHHGSDIDIAVKMKTGRSVSKLDLIYNLSGLFNDGEIDLVILTVDTDPVLLYEIFSYGKPMYEDRPDLFAEERLRAFKLYFDTEKLRRLQAEYLKQFTESSRNVA